MKQFFFIAILFASINSTLAQINQEIEYTYIDRNNHKCISTLYIKDNESVFRIDDKRANGMDEKNSTEKNLVFVNNDDISTLFYTNDTISITRIPLYKSELIYDDDGQNLEMNFTGNTKKINDYNCQEVKIDLNGRKYSIWFTPDVQTNIAPFRFNGLPGLVIELYEETNKIKLTLNSVKKSINTDTFDKYKNYILSKKVLTYGDYEKKVIEIMTTKKKNTIAKMAELKAEITYEENQSAFTQYLIDIPKNLVIELQKIN